MKTITFQLAGSDEIFQAEEWRLETAIEEAKHKTGLPCWVEYKEIDAHTEPHPDLAAYISTICDPNKSDMVAKPTRSRKTKQASTKLSTVQLVLDDTNPLDLVPGILRNRMDGSNPTIPVSVPKRDNV